jgi:hypothetical protein
MVLPTSFARREENLLTVAAAAAERKHRTVGEID